MDQLRKQPATSSEVPDSRRPTHRNKLPSLGGVFLGGGARVFFVWGEGVWGFEDWLSFSRGRSSIFLGGYRVSVSGLAGLSD